MKSDRQRYLAGSLGTLRSFAVRGNAGAAEKHAPSFCSTESEKVHITVGYGTLADLLLPGVTTITTRSRYLSMMCAAIAKVERNRQLPPGASGLTQRRKAVDPFERLWALACVAVWEAGHNGAAEELLLAVAAELERIKPSE